MRIAASTCSAQRRSATSGAVRSSKGCVRDVAHEAIVFGCQRAEDTFLLKLSPHAQREQMIGVAIDPRSDEAQVMFHAQRAS